MNVLRLFWLIPCAFLLAAPASTTFAAESACVTCHTSDATLKSLFKPPTPTGGEEGEG
jgi:hypothetical protein